MTGQDQNCTTDCPDAFAYVQVFPAIVGQTRVSWQLRETFRDSGPWAFELQVTRTSARTADDWVTVAGPLEDVTSLSDSTQRSFAALNQTHYRIKLTTGTDTYYSLPQPALGAFTNFQDRLRFAELVRAEQTRCRVIRAPQGYLLKRRLWGEVCDCVDEDTREPQKVNCENCYGTGILGGYYPPIPCVYADFQVGVQRRNALGQVRHTEEYVVEPARMLNVPQLFNRDVWVDHRTDDRYAVDAMTSEAEVNGYPVIVMVLLRQLPHTHVIYNFPITRT